MGAVRLPVPHYTRVRTCHSQPRWARWAVAATINSVPFFFFPPHSLIHWLIHLSYLVCFPSLHVLFGHAMPWPCPWHVQSKGSVCEGKRRDGRLRRCGNEWNDFQLSAHRPCSHMLYTHHNQVINRHPYTVQHHYHYRRHRSSTLASRFLNREFLNCTRTYSTNSGIPVPAPSVCTVCMYVGGCRWENFLRLPYLNLRYLSINFILGAFASLPHCDVIPVWGVRFVLRVDVWWVWMWMWVWCTVRVWMNR